MTSPATPALPETTHLRIALAWVIGFTTLRLFANALTGLELYGDEAQYWTWAQTLDLGYFTKPPLIAWIIAATTSVCGDAEACVRASSPLLHAGTALALYALGRAVAAIACNRPLPDDLDDWGLRLAALSPDRPGLAAG